MGVLRDGQNDAIVLLRRSSVLTIVVTVMRSIGVFVSLGASDIMLGRRGQLLEEMMDPVRRRRGEKKPERCGYAQV